MFDTISKRTNGIKKQQHKTKLFIRDFHFHIHYTTPKSNQQILDTLREKRWPKIKAKEEKLCKTFYDLFEDKHKPIQNSARHTKKSKKS